MQCMNVCVNGWMAKLNCEALWVVVKTRKLYRNKFTSIYNGEMIEYTDNVQTYSMNHQRQHRGKQKEAVSRREEQRHNCDPTILRIHTPGLQNSFRIAFKKTGILFIPTGCVMSVLLPVGNPWAFLSLHTVYIYFLLGAKSQLKTCLESKPGTGTKVL